ncbi:serine hydrolase domain-containing protein [Kitasatospora sp. NPDC004289]
MNDELRTATRLLLDHRLEAARTALGATAATAVVLRDGRPLWRGATGAVDGHPLDADTQFRIGSITKTLTAALVLRLRDEGRLGLDDPLGRHLAGLPEPVGAATVGQFLAHTSGVPAGPPATWRRDGTDDFPAGLFGQPPTLYPAGAVHHYSDVGFTLLGALVERHRAAPWAECVRTELLRPLGMRRTTRLPAAPAATGWAADPETGGPTAVPSYDFGVMSPSGQHWSTLDDLVRWAAFLTWGQDGVLSAATLAEMRRPAVPDGCYGLGLELWPDDPARDGGPGFAGHTGSVPGFRSALLVAPAEGLAGILLANGSTALPEGTAALVRDLVRLGTAA